ncbi:hypothetical protein [Skermania piniformis]|uniref:Uncharacterized protein n=1 Tax=Skermania pinensis TaxID=39122 RepID=A0ABX8SAV3_9ACTN|nr:hypothetical protein [Skermania piniformis]QXQ14993.1 hypothetical protein KV203_06425 [Skermania piniformis]
MRTEQRYRRAGLTGAMTAAITMTVAVIAIVVAGCGDRVDGSARENSGEASAYRSEAAASSSAAAAAAQAAATAKAKADTCGAFLGRTDPAIDAFNGFVDASNKRADDIAARRSAAVTELRKSADEVDAGVQAAGPPLDPDLAKRFADYAGAARELATAADQMQDAVQAVNQAKERFNDSLEAVRKGCD